MDGFARSIGQGIAGLVEGAFDTIGAVLRGMVNAGNQALPGGLFVVLVFVLLVVGAWSLAKR